MHTNMHTNIHTYIQTDIQTCIHTYIHACIHTNNVLCYEDQFHLFGNRKGFVLIESISSYSDASNDMKIITTIPIIVVMVAVVD
jgi:hypothetical protein